MKPGSEKINKRAELSRFFCPMDATAKRNWGRLFGSDFHFILERFAALAADWNFQIETVSTNTILWLDSQDATTECMFCFVDDITDLNAITSIFSRIKKFNPVFTYAIVHQKKDGDGTYDIFRFSRFSYLEHCNRVRSRARK
jgi:hypothetical protein